MRNLRSVSSEEFNEFIATYPAPLAQKMIGATQHYLDTSDGQVWPDNIVASYLPATEVRKRAGGWRIPISDIGEA
ncbi:MAG: hypothetical protein JWR51_4719 [Devosia sp.]|uniref:hypothetical protein n=1 Tax=Devosia sp. TaxID=1871048 RepID=UPI00262BB059|nr:hypothetical protein [Devosia sp.]MDB5531616.1 hypothetical protein [Devosia sp.]